jgi:DeoR/GlpR family transcriptional regulator of sugar metabolism
MAVIDELARQDAILAELAASGRVTVSELATKFSKSTVTIRKDLDVLERKELLRRVRGGAVGKRPSDEGAFDTRLRRSRDAKRAIAKAAAALVGRGDVIAIDSSTTCYCLGEELLEKQDIVVITNGLRLAVLLMERSSAVVVLTGGVLRKASGSVVGPIGDVLRGRGRISRGFFGVSTVSTTYGLMDLSSEQANAKKMIAESCDEVIGLFDSTKLGGFGTHSYAPVDRITAMYTDTGVDHAAVEEWSRLGVRINAVPVPGLER